MSSNIEQNKLTNELTNVFNIFKNTDAEIRPHFILTGASGSGKNHTIESICEDMDLPVIHINAAQLTKEGTAGNSLSKALAAIGNNQNTPQVCFVDEFDKLFISGNNNTDTAHETTNGVQNEFLKVLESDHADVFGDYGKFHKICIKNTLFVFAGAFNGQEDITLDSLREFGIKTEFLGRVGLVFNTQKLSLEAMKRILNKSALLKQYCEVTDTDKSEPLESINEYLDEHFENNTLGVRMINNLIHQYFIKGGKLGSEEAAKVVFTKKIKLF